MDGVRIRWRQAARLVLAVLGLALAVRLAPGLLRPPEPPPLGAGVGLPRLVVDRRASGAGGGGPARARRPNAPRRGSRRPPLAPSVISSVPHRQRRARQSGARHPSGKPALAAPSHHAPSPPAPGAPGPAPAAPLPPPAPAPAAAPAPPPPPPAPVPADGSEEFAPH